MKHYCENYILAPLHPVTVAVIGCGGTGSNIISGLAKMNLGLKAKGHPGLHVIAFDGDTVSEANFGRQLFSSCDVGRNKADVLIERINRFFRFGWEARSEDFTRETLNKNGLSNIMITCVDSYKTRVKLSGLFKPKKGINKLVPSRNNHHPYKDCYYWMDFGNLKNIGQVILGTVQSDELPTVTEHFKNVEVDEAPNVPSCSLAESLNNQDLFINSTLAQLGCSMLWQLITNAHIDYRGLYLNLETFNTNPIKIA